MKIMYFSFLFLFMELSLNRNATGKVPSVNNSFKIITYNIFDGFNFGKESVRP